MWNHVGIQNVVNVGSGIENGIVLVDGKLQQHGSILQIFIDGKLGIDRIKMCTQILRGDGRNASKHFVDIDLPFCCLNKTKALRNIALDKKVDILWGTTNW